MESFRKWLSDGVPTGWPDVLVRTVEMAIVAFLVLQLKEWVDARAFDTAAVIVDSAYIAAGTLALNAILLWAKP